jgi:hypothetical protein
MCVGMKIERIFAEDVIGRAVAGSPVAQQSGKCNKSFFCSEIVEIYHILTDI